MSTYTNTMSRLTTATRPLLALLTLPPTLLHEATHAVLAAPWASQLALVVDPVGVDAAVGIDWRPDVPTPAIVLAHYGPTVIGGLVGVAGAFWLAVAAQPASARAWLLAGTLAVWWAIYMAPSPSDRDLSPTHE